MGAKGGGGSQKTHVVEYFMSIHMGWCWGPVDALKEIWIGEKLAWSGEVTNLSAVRIDWNSLFGGRDKEGGVVGDVHFLPGSAGQIMPETLATRLGRTSATCPGFRGQCNLFFCNAGNVGSSSLFAALSGFMLQPFQGFMWGANNPYLKSVWAKFRRIPQGLSASTARIGDDANPAHIIYECMTNTDWGMGAPSSLFNIAKFEATATKLYNENFGLSLAWMEQAKIEEFVGEIVDHIQGNLFINPQTGLYELELVRNDYDVEDLPVFGPDDCTFSNYQIKGWGETVNEIVVTYTNPATEDEATVGIQNIANIAIQGGQILSDGRNYYGIRNPDLAATVAGRDLRSASTPLRSVDMITNRRGWSLVPGQPLIITWPKYNLQSVVMRVMDIDYGKPGDGAVKAALLEDVFEPGAFIAPPATEWVDPAEDAEPMEFVRPFTLPAFAVANLATDPATLDYPTAMIGVLAAQAGTDTWAYQLGIERMAPDGTLEYEDDGRLTPVGRAELEADLAAEATTVMVLPLAINGRSTAIGGFVFFGDDTDDKMEIAQVRSYDSGTGEATLNRGVLDTVPRDWPEGTPVWYASGRFYDSKFFAGGEAVNAKLLTRTSRGILDAAEAPVITFDVLDRPHLPSRPANVKANTTAFGTLDAIALSNFTVTWARRNRLFEDTVVLKWDEADTAPEAGQTTNVILLDADDRSVVHTYGGIVGTSQVVTKSHFGTAVDGIVRVVAERDGLESLQGHEIIVQVRERLFIDLGDAPASYAGHAYDFVRVNAAGTGLSFVPAPKVQLAIFRPSVFDNAEVLTRYISVEAWKLRSNLAGCKVNVGLAAFGSPVITIKKNGALVATISITGSTPTLATSGGTEVSFAIGDILDLAGPAVADSSLGNVSIVLSGIKG